MKAMNYNHGSFLTSKLITITSHNETGQFQGRKTVNTVLTIINAFIAFV